MYVVLLMNNSRCLVEFLGQGILTLAWIAILDSNPMMSGHLCVSAIVNLQTRTSAQNNIIYLAANLHFSASATHKHR